MYKTCAIGFILAVCLIAITAEKSTEMSAIAYIEGPNGVQGTVTFTQKACGENVYVTVDVANLKPGKHGFHIHEKGDLSNGCMSTGGHYNPDKVSHGSPEDEVRHVGDLGNIEANADGVARTTRTDHSISLSGGHTIIGRSVVIHEKEDDLGKGTHPDSKKTGNAGGRVACGVIGLNMNDLAEWPCPSGKTSGADGYMQSFSLLTIIIAAVIQRQF